MVLQRNQYPVKEASLQGGQFSPVTPTKSGSPQEGEGDVRTQATT